jgi:hypothetical protein
MIILNSIHRVMRAEKVLKENGLKVNLVPVPREISSDCGVAIELPAETEEAALRLFEKHGITPYDCYARSEKGAFIKRKGGAESA